MGRERGSVGVFRESNYISCCVYRIKPNTVNEVGQICTNFYIYKFMIRFWSSFRLAYKAQVSILCNVDPNILKSLYNNKLLYIV